MIEVNYFSSVWMFLPFYLPNIKVIIFALMLLLILFGMISLVLEPFWTFRFLERWCDESCSSSNILIRLNNNTFLLKIHVLSTSFPSLCAEIYLLKRSIIWSLSFLLLQSWIFVGFFRECRFASKTFIFSI